MAECRDLESLFAAYVDGEAGPGDCAALDAHFRSCPACRDRVAAERVVREAVAARRESLRGARRASCAADARPVVTAHHRGLARRPHGRACSREDVGAPVDGCHAGARRRRRLPLRARGTAWKRSAHSSPPITSSASSSRRRPPIMPDAKAARPQWAKDRGWALKVPESEPVRAVGAAGHSPLHLDQGIRRPTSCTSGAASRCLCTC